MIDKEKKAFLASFKRLIAAGLKTTFGRDQKEIAEREMVYFDTLQQFSLEAVIAAERDLRTRGTSDGWFPSAIEWADAAADYEVEFAAAVVAQRRRLPPSSVVVAEELAAIRAAREKFLAQCRAEGFAGVAALLEAMPVRHPSEATAHVSCLTCHDTGRVIVEGLSHDCACVPTNPTIRHRRAVRARQAAIEARRRRARELAPGRTPSLLTERLS